jgi:HSP20 family protein
VPRGAKRARQPSPYKRSLRSEHPSCAQENEEKKKDYYISERRYGAFERSFRLPEGIDTDKIEASFKSGVLKVVLPKTPEAQKAEKKIDVKAG